MSLLHVLQIKAHLTSLFDGLIDTSDFAHRPEQERESAFLTRSLAAFVLTHLAGISPEIAAKCVTDGGQDNGVDAFHFDNIERTLYFVQTKWRHDGTGSIERGDAQKFITGIRDIFNERFDRFNSKIQSRKAEIEEALYSTQTNFVIAIAYTGKEPLSEEVQRDFDDFLREMNDPTDIIQLRILRQGNLYHFVSSGSLGAPINFDVVIRNWGQIREPYFAYYGQVSASEVASWWESHHPRLFSPNLRVFLGDTEVNQGIMDTMMSSPEHFWYFNNGITALCGSVKKKPMGGPSNESGVFECQDIRIVNGAQTVGAIATANARSPEKTARAYVMVRFISLENCPPSFSTEVTRATNTQNRIERRDFVSLDPEQERIRTELALDGISYSYKSGDITKDLKTSCDLSEATVALACSHTDVALAVQAKREIGKLWEDITKAPYKSLFNPSVSGRRVWIAVQMLREIENALKTLYGELQGKDRMFTVHGNRFIAHQVFKRLGVKYWEDPQFDVGQDRVRAYNLTRAVLQPLSQTTNAIYPDSYLASLFKNLTKCRRISVEMEQVW